jgi:hypothetical protein
MGDINGDSVIGFKEVLYILTEGLPAEAVTLSGKDRLSRRAV